MSTHLSTQLEPLQTAEGAWLALGEPTPVGFNAAAPRNAALIDGGALAPAVEAAAVVAVEKPAARPRAAKTKESS